LALPDFRCCIVASHPARSSTLPWSRVFQVRFYMITRG
jgi:hypothetical protein